MVLYRPAHPRSPLYVLSNPQSPSRVYPPFWLRTRSSAVFYKATPIYWIHLTKRTFLLRVLLLLFFVDLSSSILLFLASLFARFFLIFFRAAISGSATACMKHTAGLHNRTVHRHRDGGRVRIRCCHARNPDKCALGPRGWGCLRHKGGATQSAVNQPRMRPSEWDVITAQQ
ncbi:hypothetical protein LSAT2_004540 [Lamellibrachia satsuma]|nr:hypothetical protein LSAT2_004540 [Lamellibrachia satsuma]